MRPAGAVVLDSYLLISAPAGEGEEEKARGAASGLGSPTWNPRNAAGGTGAANRVLWPGKAGKLLEVSADDIDSRMAKLRELVRF